MKLYTEKQTARRARAVMLWRVSLLALCALSIFALIGVILRVGTGNAVASFWACLILFTLTGWIVILARELILLPMKRVIAHERGILRSRESPEAHIGVLTRAGMWFTLPASITLMKLTLITENGENVRLSVEKSRLKLLPKDGTRVKVVSVRGFITEVEHES